MQGSFGDHQSINEQMILEEDKESDDEEISPGTLKKLRSKKRELTLELLDPSIIHDDEESVRDINESDQSMLRIS